MHSAQVVKARSMPRPTRQRLLPPPPPPLPAQRWQPPLRFLHIPKTAGTSAIVELQALGYDLGSASQATMEACYPPYKSSSPSTLNFILLREPRSHVLSQFLECRFTRFGSWVTWADSLRHAEWQKECKRTRCGINRFGERFGGSRNRTAASILAGFEPWIRHFARVQGSARRSGVDDFGCYDARSLQTRALTCARRGGYASHHYDGEANLAGAMERWCGRSTCWASQSYTTRASASSTFGSRARSHHPASAPRTQTAPPGGGRCVTSTARMAGLATSG